MAGPIQKDHLTGFFKRCAQFFSRQAQAEAKDSSGRFSIALIDLDKFKKYNDKFGRLFGDEALKYAAGIFRMTFYGDLNYYYRQAKEELIKKADEAMYYSKRNGFNKITLFNKLPRLKLRRLAVVIGVILAGAIFYKLSFKTLISPTLREVKKIKIATKPGDLDAVVLKNGDLYEDRIIEKTGEAEAETADGREAEIKKGDLAFFPQGLSCERYIKSKVKKYYSFE